MSVTGNFASITKKAKGLEVSGNSASPLNGELMSRHVALSQGKKAIKADDDVLATGGWSVGVAGADAFSDEEPVLAVGIETYFMKDASAMSGDALPSFVSFTWSQILQIT